MDFPLVLDRVTHAFGGLGIRHALCGGLALQARGHLRATADVDFAVDGDRQADALAEIDRLGYETLGRSAGFSNHLHGDPVFGRLDIVFVRGGTADRLFSASEPREAFPGLTVPVLRAEHLAAMKAAAIANPERREKRLQDKADVAFLLRRPETDRGEVREYFRRFGVLGELDEIERSLGE